MGNVRVNPEWINTNRVKFFNLLEYVSQIKLDDNTLYHCEETSESFEKYLKVLGEHCDYNISTIISYWLDDSIRELKDSSIIESHNFSIKEMMAADLFFDRLAISHNRIKRIHEFVCDHSGTNAKEVGKYRSDIAFVGVQLDAQTFQPYWYGAEAKDIKKFVDSFLDYYRKNGIADIYINPFIRAALVHLLFVRIHPFGDGNGRTARILQNIAFTSEINKIYDTNLKISPLNVSQSINLNRQYYVDCLDRIYFDLEHPEENNKAINKWIDFMLNMYDEQLFFHSNRLPIIDKIKDLNEIKNLDMSNLDNKYSQMKVKRLLK